MVLNIGAGNSCLGLKAIGATPTQLAARITMTEEEEARAAIRAQEAQERRTMGRLDPFLDFDEVLRLGREVEKQGNSEVGEMIRQAMKAEAARQEAKAKAEALEEAMREAEERHQVEMQASWAKVQALENAAEKAMTQEVGVTEEAERKAAQAQAKAKKEEAKRQAGTAEGGWLKAMKRANRAVDAKATVGEQDGGFATGTRTVPNW